MGEENDSCGGSHGDLLRGGGVERGRAFTPKISSLAKVEMNRVGLRTAQAKRRRRAKAARVARKRSRR